jgi:hypothetical protein
MGLLKKIFKPVSKVLDKIVPNEIKPILPYLAAFAPHLAGMQGIMGSGMMQRALMSGGLNIGAQLAQEGNEGDVNWLSTALASGVGALSAPGTPSTTGVDKFGSIEVPYSTAGTPGAQGILEAKAAGMDPGWLQSGTNMLGKGAGILTDASKVLQTDPFSMAGLKAATIPLAQGTGDVLYAEAQRALKDYEDEMAAAGTDTTDAGRALAIRLAMEAGGHDEDTILETIESLGYKKGGRVGFNKGGGADWINTHEPGPMGNPAVIEEIENMREWRIANPDVEDVTDYSLEYESKKPNFGGLEEAIINIKEEQGGDLVASRAGDFFMLREEAIGRGDHDKIKEIESDFFKEFGIPMPAMGSMPKAEGIQMAAKGPILPSDEDPVNPFAPKPTGPVLPNKMMAAKGGRINKNKGGMMSVLPKGIEADYRGGGFIPIGSRERADDVPARLSENEFAMTADAVRAAGGGSVNQGAQRMYNLMHNLEARA